MDVVSVPTAVYNSILGGREKGETDGSSLYTHPLQKHTGSQETNLFIYHTPLSEIKCLGQGHIHEESVSDPNSGSVPSSEHRGECTGTGCKAGKMKLAAHAKLSLCSQIQTSSTCPVALKQQTSAGLYLMQPNCGRQLFLAGENPLWRWT